MKMSRNKSTDLIMKNLKKYSLEKLSKILFTVFSLGLLLSPVSGYAQDSNTTGTTLPLPHPTSESTKTAAEQKLDKLEAELASAGVSKEDAGDILDGVIKANNSGDMDIRDVEVAGGNINYNGAEIPVKDFADYVSSKGEAGESVVNATGGFFKGVKGFSDKLDEKGIGREQRSKLFESYLSSRRRGFEDKDVLVNRDGSISVRGRNFGSPAALESFYDKVPEGIDIGRLSLEQIKNIDEGKLTIRRGSDGKYRLHGFGSSVLLSCFIGKCGNDSGSSANGKPSSIPEKTVVAISRGPSEEHKLIEHPHLSSESIKKKGYVEQPLSERQAAPKEAAADPKAIGNPSGAMGNDVRETPQGSTTAAGQVFAGRSEKDTSSQNYGNSDLELVQKNGSLMLPRTPDVKITPSFSYNAKLHKEADAASTYRSIYQVNLGVHDELLKREMPIFYSPERIGKSFLASEKLKAEYLAQFETPRAIAIMTLNYLDKTVAAGLATTEQQSQLRQVAHLLKQSNNHTAKMANPRWAHLIDDNMDKFTQCMVAGEPGITTSSRFKLNIEYCTEEDAEGNTVCPEPTEGNLFEFCSCCADQTVAPNLATDVIEAKYTGAEEGTYSLVDQLVFGTVKSTTRAHRDGNTNDELLAELATLAKDFKETYGDVVITKNNDVDDSIREGAVGLGQGMVTIVKPPAFTPAELVKLHRDGCINNDDQPCTEEEENVAICPSLYHLLETAWHDEDKNPDGSYVDTGTISDGPGTEIDKSTIQEIRDLRLNVVSKGGVKLTRGNIRQLLRLDSLDPSEMRASYDFKAEDKQRILEWANDYCDASAYSFLVSSHGRMTDMVADLLTLNSTLEEYQRVKILRLMNRLSSYIANQNSSIDPVIKVRRLVQKIEKLDANSKAIRASSRIHQTMSGTRRGHGFQQ